eukprot:TRINITY_DN16595_c0_g1_i1.p1 TRINITY_DN16595_c0_g1~~TRINITY_DN16595_c0_g1_i1.p1  ORF type:complete len:122 (+),score=17.39 TRINITY_DN16595_c0_g1_i1:95-460(+)
MGARQFKSHHQTWLIAEDNTLHANHSSEGHKSHFHIENHGLYHTIRTHHGKYLAETADHKLYLTHDAHHHDAHWHVEHHHDGGKVALRSIHGNYISVDARGHVRTHHERGHDELFTEVIVS